MPRSVSPRAGKDARTPARRPRNGERKGDGHRVIGPGRGRPNTRASHARVRAKTDYTDDGNRDHLSAGWHRPHQVWRWARAGTESGARAGLPRTQGGAGAGRQKCGAAWSANGDASVGSHGQGEGTSVRRPASRPLTSAGQSFRQTRSLASRDAHRPGSSAVSVSTPAPPAMSGASPAPPFCALFLILPACRHPGRTERGWDHH